MPIVINTILMVIIAILLYFDIDKIPFLSEMAIFLKLHSDHYLWNHQSKSIQPPPSVSNSCNGILRNCVSYFDSYLQCCRNDFSNGLLIFSQLIEEKTSIGPIF